jgi:hypothetical protein
MLVEGSLTFHPSTSAFNTAPSSASAHSTLTPVIFHKCCTNAVVRAVRAALATQAWHLPVKERVNVESVVAAGPLGPKGGVLVKYSVKFELVRKLHTSADWTAMAKRKVKAILSEVRRAHDSKRVHRSRAPHSPALQH